MLHIDYWQSGAYFWDPAVSKVPYDVTFVRRDRRQRCIAPRTKTKTIYS
jgi:hypothetical protein